MFYRDGSLRMLAYLAIAIGAAAMFSLTAISAFAGSLAASGAATTVERIEGVYLGGGVTCPRFQMPDGRQISLFGTVPDVSAGTRLSLLGRWAIVSGCMEGRAFFITGGGDDK